MCERISQKRSVGDYLEAMAWRLASPFLDPVGPRHDVAPDANVLVLHRLGAGTESVTRIRWGYSGTGKKRYSNARAYDLSSNPFWRPLLERGRCIIPADGWYEWGGPDGQNRPWFIQQENAAPLFIAAVTDWRFKKAPSPGTGISIATVDAQGGMVDPRDPPPVVLAPAQARDWLNPATTLEQASEILSQALPKDAFKWQAVTRETGG